MLIAIFEHCSVKIPEPSLHAVHAMSSHAIIATSSLPCPFRSMPTSAALDVVAKELGLKFFEVRGGEGRTWTVND